MKRLERLMQSAVEQGLPGEKMIDLLNECPWEEDEEIIEPWVDVVELGYYDAERTIFSAQIYFTSLAQIKKVVRSVIDDQQKDARLELRIHAEKHEWKPGDLRKWLDEEPEVYEKKPVERIKKDPEEIGHRKF